MLACLPAMAAEQESRKDHKEYDFHYDIRYPGRLRSDVGFDAVKQKKPDDLKGYHRRTVKWWPKRGMDFTPLEEKRQGTHLLYTRSNRDSSVLNTAKEDIVVGSHPSYFDSDGPFAF